jgi:predicted GIY-YIG superfamily endonuclease
VADMICVYVLLSLKDGDKYIGSTVDLYRRIGEHARGQSRSSRDRRPFVLLGYQETSTIKEAAALEKKFKHSHDSLLRSIRTGSFIIVNKDIF